VRTIRRPKRRLAAALVATCAITHVLAPISRSAFAQPSTSTPQEPAPAPAPAPTLAPALAPASSPALASGAPVEVSVRGTKAPTGAIGAEDFRARDARDVPGTFGDAFQSIAALPGISPMASGLPYFYVRGAPPADTGYFVDGVPVPTLFHIGPGSSVLPQALVNRVDFFPGAAPARYGRFAGGIIASETSAPTGVAHGEAGVRLFDASVFAEAPIGDTSDLVVAGRYGYPNLLLSIFAPNLSLHFGDYTVRWTQRLSDVDRITLFVLGAYDREQDSTLNLVPIDSQFHRVDLRYDRTWSTGSLRLATTFGYDRTAGNVPESPAEVVTSTSERVRLELRQRLGQAAELSAGADANAIHYAFGVGGFDSTAAVGTEPAGDEVVLGAYADLTLHVAPGVDVAPGVRVDEYRPSSGLAGSPAFAVDPKLVARIALSRAVTWISTLGLAHQEASFVLPVPGLRVVSSAGLQAVYSMAHGAEVSLPAEIKARLTGFLNADRHVSDFVASCGALLDCSSISDVDGTTYGLELLVERALTHHLGGWLSYTVSRAPRVAEGQSYLSPFDRTHVLNAVLHYDFGRGFGAGIRGTYYSGRPDTPVFPLVGATPIEKPIPGGFTQYRLPAYGRADFRVDKRWDFGQGRWLTGVVEFFDATLTKEAVDFDCNFTRHTCTPAYVGPIALPSIGLEAGW
jgi:hypothetical protein